MTDESSRNDPLADVINALAAPIAGGLRSVEQFQRGVGELFRAVENLNRTLENLNETTTRVNRLVGEMEEPVRAMMPQVTRTVQAADEMTRLLQGPVRVAAPQIERMVDTMSSPAFADLPHQLGDFMKTISDVSTRLAPLTQLAENAGGLLGAFKLPGMAGAPKPASTAASASTVVDGSNTGAARQATVTARTSKASAKTTTAKRTPAKKTTAKKATAKKTTAKNSTKKKAAKKASAKPAPRAKAGSADAHEAE